MFLYRVVLKSGDTIDNLNSSQVNEVTSSKDWSYVIPMESVEIKKRMKSLKKGERLKS